MAPQQIQIPVDRLPELDACGYCGTERAVMVSMEMDAHYITRGWVVTCLECACSTDAHLCLPDAAEEWNTEQRRRAQLMRQAQFLETTA